MNKTKKKQVGGSEAFIPGASIGMLAGHTLARKTRKGETWFSHMLGSYLDLVWYLSKSFIKAGSYAYKEAVIYSIDYTFGKDITSMSLEELTAEVKDKLIKSAKLAAIISEDKDAMQDLRDTGKLSAEIFGNVLLAMEDPLQDATNEALDLLETICLNLAKAGVDISIGILGAILGAIPFLGGLINLIIASGYAFNSATRVVTDSSKGLGKVGEIMGASTGKIADAILKEQPKFAAMVAKDKETLEDADKKAKEAADAEKRKREGEGEGKASPAEGEGKASPAEGEAPKAEGEGAAPTPEDKNETNAAQTGGTKANFDIPIINYQLLNLINKLNNKDKLFSKMSGGGKFDIPVRNKKCRKRICRKTRKQIIKKARQRRG